MIDNLYYSDTSVVVPRGTVKRSGMGFCFTQNQDCQASHNLDAL